jgi:uncharacterized protein YndB with AHSA1/START domain
MPIGGNGRCSSEPTPIPSRVLTYSRRMKIIVEQTVKAELARVWSAWTTPEDINEWNTAQDDWHTTRTEVDLREGGKFTSRMEAVDGSQGFDFEGTYTRIVPQQVIEYRMPDGRDVKVEFIQQENGVLVRETFDAEDENSHEMQRAGWQAILNNFARYAERASALNGLR